MYLPVRTYVFVYMDTYVQYCRKRNGNETTPLFQQFSTTANTLPGTGRAQCLRSNPTVESPVRLMWDLAGSVFECQFT